MKTLPLFRKPNLSALALIILAFIAACDSNTEAPQDELVFNFETFENFKDSNINHQIPAHILDIPNETLKYTQVTSFLNDQMGSDLKLTDLDKTILSERAAGTYSYSTYSQYLNETDLQILGNFQRDASALGVSGALSNLEQNVRAQGLSESEFRKYNAFANVVMLLENETSGLFATSDNIAIEAGEDPCAEAIAAYSLATIGLAACGLSGPFAPIVCGAAIAAKILAFRAMVRDCGDDAPVDA